MSTTQQIIENALVPKPLLPKLVIPMVTSYINQFWNKVGNSTGDDNKTTSVVVVAGMGILALTIGFIRIKVKKGNVALFLHPVVYDFIDAALWLPNQIISVACYFQPAVFINDHASTWNENDERFTPQALAKIKNEVHLNSVKESIIKHQNIVYNEQDLVQIYDSLPAVKMSELLVGKGFHGQILRTNLSVLDVPAWLLVMPLTLLGFGWGKRYQTQHIGDPLMVNWMRKIYFPLPLWGNVGVVDIVWRDVCTGTMNYDGHAWKDYFRVLKSGDKYILLGVWTNKDKAGGWFTLTYDNSIPM
jgi:hypothetical protein